MQYRHSTITAAVSASNSRKTSSHYRPARNGATTRSTLSRQQAHPRQRHQLQRPHRSYQLRRSCITAFLTCFIVLICCILTITHTLGIRLTKRSKSAYQSRTSSSSSTTSMAALVVPYPSTEVQISVIIMNHARPYILQQSQLLRTLVTHPNVQSIFILHSNPKTKFDNEYLIPHLARTTDNGTSITAKKFVLTPTVSLLNQKIKHIDAVAMNKQMGLAIRFHYCAELCNSTKLVMHVDDDMEFSSHSVINTLVRNMLQNPKRIVGHYGRTYNAWTAPFRHGYDTRTVYGNVEVVLTKILILEQKLCQQFFKYTHLVTDILNRTTDVVKWNGEDIFINLIANHFYHVPKNGPYNNYAIPDLDVWDVDTSIFDTMNEKRNGILELSQQLRGSRKDIAVAPASTTNVILENAVSGNMDRNRIWNVGFYQWLIAYQKAQSHTKFRGVLWYTTKQRLYKQSTL